MDNARENETMATDNTSKVGTLWNVNVTMFDEVDSLYLTKEDNSYEIESLSEEGVHIYMDEDNVEKAIARVYEALSAKTSLMVEIESIYIVQVL